MFPFESLFIDRQCPYSNGGVCERVYCCYKHPLQNAKGSEALDRDDSLVCPKPILPSIVPEVKHNEVLNQTSILPRLKKTRSVTCANISKEKSDDPNDSLLSKNVEISNIRKDEQDFTKIPNIKYYVQSFVPDKIRQLHLENFIKILKNRCGDIKECHKMAYEAEYAIILKSNSKTIYSHKCLESLRKFKAMPETESQTNSVEHQLRYNTEINTASASLDLIPKPIAILSEIKLHEILITNYVLSTENLLKNGFPFPSTCSSTVAQIQNLTLISSDSLLRQCMRCDNTYSIEDMETDAEGCHYHSGKIHSRKLNQSEYDCCHGTIDSPSCCFSPVHLSQTDFILKDFVSTSNWKNVDTTCLVLAIDCEMCFTTMGTEVTRVTLVNWECRNIYDEYVKPNNKIIDYFTKFSGITKASLENVTKTLHHVHNDLTKFISAKTIIIGHSLESDLKALKLFHSNCVDTTLMFPHRTNQNAKRALKTIALEYLDKNIQEGSNGHNSFEDARTCMELVIKKASSFMKPSLNIKNNRRI